MERFRGGDKAAFDEIVLGHRRELYRVARKILDSHEDADEATQEAFVRAWRGLDRFRGDASLRTWLIRIVLNVSRTMRSSRGEAWSMDEADRVPDSSEGSEERIERAEVQRRVREAVALLPPRQQEAVVLKVFSGMTYKEVAAVMGLSEGAVKAHLHQAVSNLRKRMA